MAIRGPAGHSAKLRRGPLLDEAIRGGGVGRKLPKDAPRHCRCVALVHVTQQNDHQCVVHLALGES